MFKISCLKNTLSDYIRVKFELFKLDLTDHLSNILAQMIAILMIVLIAMVVIIFLSIALALQFNHVFESESLGFVAVASIYLVMLFIVLYLLKSGKLKSFFESKLMNSISPNAKKTNEEQE